MGEYIDCMEICTNLQKNVAYGNITLLQWASLESTSDARKFLKHYRKQAARDNKMFDWDVFKSELIHLYGNRLSKENAQRRILALQHPDTIDEDLNEIPTLESEAQIDQSFLKTTNTNYVRVYLQCHIMK